MYVLPPLPYAHDALEPVIGSVTMQIHHGKHHQRYVTVMNGMVGDSMLSLEELITDAKRRGDTKLFNNAAQAWNHAFFWESMAPQPVAPAGALKEAIHGAFGSLEGLRKEFVAKGAAQFGSGWIWLVACDNGLQVVTTHDADLPWVGTSAVPVLLCDVWEHAYYLDYRSERGRFLCTWFDKLANWDYAAKQLSGGAGRYRYPAPTLPAASG
jgi:superoxide dismutase, Fe-Mn family